MNLDTLRQLKPSFKHLLIAFGSGLIIVITFFYLFLPVTTNHGETISVPDLTNQTIEDLEELLSTRRLRYEVNRDSSFNPDQKPLTVLDQYPKAGSKVKENRKIYITLNAKKPPMVRMPDLKDKSLMIAQITLQSFGLSTGKISYRSDMALNAVLEQQWNGKEIAPGTPLPKGSKIDLYIGDGFGSRSWQMFNYVNQPLSDARIALIGVGLQIGSITYVKTGETTVPPSMIGSDTIPRKVFVPKGHVVRHSPGFGETVRLEDRVDLWVYQTDSTTNQTSILEEDME